MCLGFFGFRFFFFFCLSLIVSYRALIRFWIVAAGTNGCVIGRSKILLIDQVFFGTSVVDGIGLHLDRLLDMNSHPIASFIVQIVISSRMRT